MIVYVFIQSCFTCDYEHYTVLSMIMTIIVAGFFKENVRYPIWTCRVLISLILGTRFSILPESGP